MAVRRDVQVGCRQGMAAAADLAVSGPRTGRSPGGALAITAAGAAVEPLPVAAQITVIGEQVSTSAPARAPEGRCVAPVQRDKMPGVAALGKAARLHHAPVPRDRPDSERVRDTVSLTPACGHPVLAAAVGQHRPAPRPTAPRVPDLDLLPEPAVAGRVDTRPQPDSMLLPELGPGNVPVQPYRPHRLDRIWNHRRVRRLHFGQPESRVGTTPPDSRVARTQVSGRLRREHVAFAGSRHRDPSIAPACFCSTERPPGPARARRSTSRAAG